ncbi:MAG: hypothetical protein JO079_02445 [Frankiaceae bacterium]|nr:hypothetical protein [Frankiaceae bacterium]MBV9369078.1 hypothetical protein [Frankiales bacterium]
MPDDAAWADHLVVPDDARELAPDVDAYHRELRAARRARRWGWLTGSRAWQRWSFPLGMVAGALSLALLMFVLLAVESAPSHTSKLAAAPLATPTVAPGVKFGLLPDTPLASAPAGTSGTVRSAVALRPALVALVPIPCQCTDVVRALAKQAHAVGVRLAVVAPGSRDAEVSALPGQVSGVTPWYDATGTLAAAYGARGVTVLVVDPDGVVSYVQRNTTAQLVRSLPTQSLLLLPPYGDGG